ncbi:MAG: hypothetical protein ACLP50_24360 [Solirubrobacteraceae bacterium]
MKRGDLVDLQRRANPAGRARALLSPTRLLSAIPALAVVATAAVALLGPHFAAASAPSAPAQTAAAGLPPVPPLSPANRPVLAYVDQAEQSVFQHDKGCRPAPGRLLGSARPDQGSPGPMLLSMFGVLRRPGTVPLPASMGGRLISGVFVNYVRLAQHRYGSDYFLFPVAHLYARTELSARCRALELTTLSAKLDHAAPALRAQALELAQQELRDQRYIAQHPDGVCLFGGGGGGCEPFLLAQATGGIQSAGYGTEGSTFAYVVPDGVATITAHYPAEGPKTGFRRHIPALTTTVQVLNNLAVWRLAHEPGDLFPTTILWRSRTGRRIRTVYPG